MSTPANQRRGWSGTTKNTLEKTAMLGGKWWEKGDKLACIFSRTFETKFGTGYEFMLVQPSTLTVNVDQYGVTTKKGEGVAKIITRFAMPSLAGFEMALQDMMGNGFEGLRFGDKVLIECVDIQESSDSSQSPMPQFDVSVDPR